jgi:hypothetical protein
MVATLTPHGVRVHFRAAKLAGIPFISLCDTCCNSRGVALFASAYRHWRIQRGFPDPETSVCHAPRSLSVSVFASTRGRHPSKVVPERGEW